MTLWAEKQGVRLEYIQPGNPQQNAYVERYNRTVRYDWLGHYLFESIAEVQDYGTNWIWTYNHERPGLGIGFGFEGFSLGWIALAADLRFPLILAAIPDCCHFDHSRHVQVWQICGKNDFQD